MAKQKEYLVGVYVRLSNEDARAGESVSIENQKLMLTKHVKEMGWELKEIYQDDGFSGTNQNRPAFQRMLADVKQGFINTILIKDLSRLGRNYLEVGNLAEVFLPEHGCELISLNEKLDDLMVFRNWFNEQHCKTTSQKVRASRRICAENGKFMGAFAPYGFKKNTENRHQLAVDDNTAPIVRRIFEMRASGMGFRAIASKLNEDGVTSPREYYYQSRHKRNPTRTNSLWNESALKDLIRNEVYIGNSVQCKKGTVSYKNSRLVSKPQDEWVRVENTHEPIISRELWDTVQQFAHKNYRPRRRKDGTTTLFTGLLECEDCGFKLRSTVQHGNYKDGSEYSRIYYNCGNYARSGKTACTVHSISEKALVELVTEHIRNHALMVESNEERIIEAILTMQNNESKSYRAAYQSEIAAHKKQVDKLDLLIENLYNDRVSGVVPEDMFKRYISKYESERVDRLQSVGMLEKRIAAIKQDIGNAETWAKLIKRYTEIETLDSETLVLLIDKIIVGEVHVIGKERVRDISIAYNYVGDLGNLLPNDGGGENNGNAEATLYSYDGETLPHESGVAV